VLSEYLEYPIHTSYEMSAFSNAFLLYNSPQILVKTSRVQTMVYAAGMRTPYEDTAVNVGNVQILKTGSWYAAVIARRTAVSVSWNVTRVGGTDTSPSATLVDVVSNQFDVGVKSSINHKPNTGKSGPD
jgi:hypothetical protein